MARKGILIIAALSFVLLLCGCDQFPWGYFPVTPVDNEPMRNVPDVDVPMYSLTLSDGKVVSDADYVINLDMSGKDSLRILNFADLHLTDEVIDGKPGKYLSFLLDLDALVAEAGPDMITLTGDQVPGGGLGALDSLGEKISSYGVPQAPVFGNHDCDHGGVTSIERQAEIYESFPNCLFRRGPEGLNRVLETGADSIGNYVVNLVRIEGGSFTVVRSLIFMNTGSSEIYNESDYPGQRRYEGINFVYGVKTGPLSYGNSGRGGTVITVKSDGSVSFTNIFSE